MKFVNKYKLVLLLQYYQDLCQGDVLSYPQLAVLWQTMKYGYIYIADMPVANILQGWNIACVLS